MPVSPPFLLLVYISVSAGRGVLPFYPNRIVSGFVSFQFRRGRLLLYNINITAGAVNTRSEIAKCRDAVSKCIFLTGGIDRLVSRRIRLPARLVNSSDPHPRPSSVIRQIAGRTLSQSGISSSDVSHKAVGRAMDRPTVVRRETSALISPHAS